MITSTKQVIEALREKAKTNKLFNDAFTEMALRQRTRYAVTVHGLAQRMKTAGFAYSDEQYGEVLRFLASLGFGALELDKSGRPKALKHVKTTLQSIGQVACGQTLKLANYRQRNRFEKIVAQVEPLQSISKQLQSTGQPLAIVVSINGKPIDIPVPNSLSPEEVGMLVARLRSGSRDEDRKVIAG